MLDGEILDLTDADAGATHRRRPTVLVAAVAAVALVVAGVVLTRPGGRAGSAPPPAPLSHAVTGPAVEAGDILTPTGIGRIQLGMSGSDFRSLYAGPGAATDQFMLNGTDEVRDCLRYADYSQPAPTYAWVRDDQVVTIGVAVQVEVSRVATAFGATVGEPFDIVDELGDWEVDTAAPVPVARLIEGDSVVTMADSDADGILDFASVGTSAGDECQVDEPPWQERIGEDAPPYEAGALLGVGIGMSVEQVEALPGWERTGSQGACVTYWGDGGGAFVRGGMVVGLSLMRVVDGPSMGQTVDEAVASVGADRVRLGEPESHGVWTTEMTVDGSTMYTLHAITPAEQLDGLDIDVSPPVGAGERVIVGVLLGETCDDWGAP